jgi:hypothetical protein
MPGQKVRSTVFKGPRAGHPRLIRRAGSKMWMAGTSPAVTE